VKLKFDENFDVRLVPLFRVHGHDVDTARAEGLSGAADETVYDRCREAGRVLVTLDLDFSNPLRFPPEGTEGILVVRPFRPVLSAIRATLIGALPELSSASVKGTLQILEPGRIRIYRPGEEAGGAELE